MDFSVQHSSFGGGASANEDPTASLQACSTWWHSLPGRGLLSDHRSRGSGRVFAHTGRLDEAGPRAPRRQSSRAVHGAQFRRYAEDSRLEIVVAFCSMRGTELAVDPDFATSIAWDIPLLDGYRWVRSRDLAGRRVRRIVGSFNPDLWRIVRRGAFDVVVCYGYRSASFWIAALAARASGAKLVWATDANRVEPRGDRQIDRWKPRFKRLVIPRLLGVSDAVLASSSQGVRYLSSMGVPPSKSFLIPSAVDNEFFERGAGAADRSLVRRHGACRMTPSSPSSWASSRHGSDPAIS